MITKLIGLSVLLGLASYYTVVLAADIAESVDRPSARQPDLPTYQPGKKPTGFTLPVVPIQPKSNPADKNRRVFIQRIIIEGNSVFPNEELERLTQPYQSREVSIAELEELRQSVTRYYVDRGYIDSGAVIDTENFNNGELHFKIVEGRVDEVRLTGLGRLREGYVKNRLLPDPEQPLNLIELQQNFQLLLSDPLIKQMNARILPSTSPGHSILDLDVIRAPSYHWGLSANNHRPPSIGAEGLSVTASVNNLTGWGDNIDFNFITSSGSNRYAGGFQLPLTDSGTIAFFHFDEGDSLLIEAPLKQIDIKSQIHNLEGGFSHPIMNTLHQHLDLGLMLAVRENQTSLLGQPFSFIPGLADARNQVTVWRIFQDYTQRLEHQAISLRSTFSVGMNALGATPKTQSNNPSSEFFSWLGQGQYAYLVDEDSGMQAILRGNLQLSDTALLPLERIAIGGVNTVRGYRENYLVRDQGYSLALELHYPLIGGKDSGAEQKLELIPFLDYGRAWNHGEQADSLYSVGLGFYGQYKFLRAELFYGYALNRPLPRQSGNLQDDGLHFQVKIADAF